MSTSLIEQVGAGLDGISQLKALIASGRKPGILLGLSRMNRILELDYDIRCAVVQPGVTNASVTRAVERAGMSRTRRWATRSAAGVSSSRGATPMAFATTR